MQHVDSSIIDAYPLMTELKQELINLSDNKEYGTEACNLLSNQNEDDRVEVDIVLKRSIDCAIRYLNLWFKFDDAEGLLRKQLYESFSLIYTVQMPNTDPVLAVLLPTTEEIYQVTSQFNLNVNFNLLEEEQSAIYASIKEKVDIGQLQSVSVTERWRTILALVPNCSEMLKVMSFVLSLPLSSATAERTFSYMQYKYRSERMSLTPGMLRSELIIKHNLQHVSCEEFINHIADDTQFLDSIASSQKYENGSKTANNINNAVPVDITNIELRKCNWHILLNFVKYI